MNVLRQLYESKVFLEQQLCRSQSELKSLALKVIVFKGFGERNSSEDHFTCIGNYSIRWTLYLCRRKRNNAFFTAIICSYNDQSALLKIRKSFSRECILFDFSWTINVKQDRAVITLHPIIIQHFKFNNLLAKLSELNTRSKISVYWTDFALEEAWCWNFDVGLPSLCTMNEVSSRIWSKTSPLGSWP